MADSESYTFISSSSRPKVFDDWEGINGATGLNPSTSFEAALRRHYHDLAVTVTTSNNGTFSTNPMNSKS